MARVKRGTTAKRRHKAVLALTKGHRSVRHKLFRRAKESMLHALSYSFAHRRKKKGDMRRLWILRINAAARENGLTYSQLINGLTKLGSSINRKVLAEMALRDPGSFSQVVDQVRGEIANPTK